MDSLDYLRCGIGTAAFAVAALIIGAGLVELRNTIRAWRR
jgi:hypothetical protein